MARHMRPGSTSVGSSRPALEVPPQVSARLLSKVAASAIASRGAVLERAAERTFATSKDRTSWTDLVQRVGGGRGQTLDVVDASDTELIDYEHFDAMKFQEFVQYTKATEQLARLTQLTDQLTELADEVQYSTLVGSQLKTVPGSVTAASIVIQDPGKAQERDHRKAQRAAKRAERRGESAAGTGGSSVIQIPKPAAESRRKPAVADPLLQPPSNSSSTSTTIPQVPSGKRKTRTPAIPVFDETTSTAAIPSTSAAVSVEPSLAPPSTTPSRVAPPAELGLVARPSSSTSPALALPPPLPILPVGLPPPIPVVSSAPTSTTQAQARQARNRAYTPSPSIASPDVDAKAKRKSSVVAKDGTTQFLKTMGNSVLLTAAEEKQFALLTQDLLQLKKVEQQLRNILKRDPDMEEWATACNMDVRSFQQRLHKGEMAKRRMVDANTRLVVSICKKYQNIGVALQDLITEGINGLLKGVEKFDPDKGFRFSTYAHWWIRQAITRNLSDEGRIVRLPVHMYEALCRVRKVEKELTRELGRVPTTQELAVAAKMPYKRLVELQRAAGSAGSLDAQVMDDDSASTMKDMLEDERMTSDEIFGQESVKSDILDIMDKVLTKKEVAILKLRFGLEDQEEHTLEDVGKVFGVTRERIRQIEMKALRKLGTEDAALDQIRQDFDNAGSSRAGGRTSRATRKQS